jgi:hypothetical protein
MLGIQAFRDVSKTYTCNTFIFKVQEESRTNQPLKLKVFTLLQSLGIRGITGYTLLSARRPETFITYLLAW